MTDKNLFIREKSALIRVNFLVLHIGLPGALFKPELKKIRKSTPKKLIIFREMEHSCSKIKKFYLRKWKP